MIGCGPGRASGVADMRCDRLGVRQRLFGETKRPRDVDAAAPPELETPSARASGVAELR